MINQQRLDELKRCDNPHKFFDEFYCEVNSIVKPNRKVFEDKSHRFHEKHLKFLATVEKWLKEQKKPLKPSGFEPYLKQLSGASNFKSPEQLSILEQCQKQLSNILAQGVNKNNHLVLSCERRVLKQCQEQLYDTLRQVGDKNFVLMPELSIIEQCLRDIRQQYQRADWKEIKILHSEQIRKCEYRTFPPTLFVPPDFPDDPDWWLEAYSLLWYDPKAPVARNEFTCSPEDELLRGYIALALLFNEQAEKRGETPIASDILSEFWIPQHTVKVLQACWTETENKSRQKPTDYWPEIRNVLINDLIAVDKDLPSTKRNEQKQQGKQAIKHNSFMNLEQLCKQFNVPNKNKQAFRKRLERFRAKNAFGTDAFIESQNKGGQQSKYLYNVKMVASIAEEVKGRSASLKRPSKKKDEKN
ncbi:MAG: hypothetical protein ABSG97_03920 [Sedimentisphaerales bacterium]|jgi:hypothetical protein